MAAVRIEGCGICVYEPLRRQNENGSLRDFLKDYCSYYTVIETEELLENTERLLKIVKEPPSPIRNDEIKRLVVPFARSEQKMPGHNGRVAVYTSWLEVRNLSERLIRHADGDVHALDYLSCNLSL